MNLTSYFLKHPVVTLVLNMMIVLVGLLCFYTLSVRDYPEVHFPTFMVYTSYPNASAELVETSVTNILEDQLAGIEGVETITSESRSGLSTITITFHMGTSLDKSLMAVREAVGLAQATLPKEANNPTIDRKTVSSGMPFIILALESSSVDFAALTHYANLNLKNVFRSIKGVSSIEVLGQPYMHRIILNPQKMYSFGVNADEVFNALKQSNMSLPVGKFQNEVPSTLNIEFKNISDYENLLIKEKDFSDPKHKHSPVFLKQVADIILAADDQQFRIHINGKPGLCIAINKTNDANPLNVSKEVQTKLMEIKDSLPYNAPRKVDQ